MRISFMLKIYRKKNTDFLYEVEECKSRQKIKLHGLMRIAYAGDFIVQAIHENGEKIGDPYIAQAEEFYRDFEVV